MCSEEFIFWRVTANTIFTVAVTLFVFFLGQFLARFFESKKERRRLEDLKIFYKETLNSVVQQIQKQKESCNAFSDELASGKHTDFTFRMISNPHLNTIERIDQKDIYQIFVRYGKEDITLKSKQFGELQNTLERIALIIKHVKHEYPRFLNDYNQFGRQYREHIDKAFAIFDYLGTVYSQPQLKQKPLSDIITILTKWKALGSESPFEDKDTLITPLIQIGRNNPTQETCAEMLRPLVNALYGVTEMGRTKSFYEKQFRTLSSSLDETVTVIKDFLKFYYEK